MTTKLRLIAVAAIQASIAATAIGAPTEGVDGQGTKVDGVLYLHDVETLEYIRGTEFDEDWRGAIVLGKTQLREVMDVLGRGAYDEYIDDQHWVVYEYVATTVSVADAMERVGRRSMVESVRGKRLRLKLGSGYFHVVVDWVYESWSPENRVVETAAYFHSGPPKTQEVSRESVIRDAETLLDAAGISDTAVRRSMINNALAAEGMEPLAEDEGGDEGQ